MKTITTSQRLELLGLFVLADSLLEQENHVERAVMRLVNETDRNSHTADALFGNEGSPEHRLIDLLEKLNITVSDAVQAAAPEWYNLNTLEKARQFWKSICTTGSYDDHNIEMDAVRELSRNPHFVQWVGMPNHEKALFYYYENELLQLDKDTIIRAALEVGFNPQV